MRVATIIFVFAASALALPGTFERRQAQPIVDAFKDINGKIATFDHHIQQLTARSDVAATAKTLTAASKDIVAVLEKGTAAIAKDVKKQLSLKEALPLAQEATGLAKIAQTSIDHLIEKKDIIIKANQKQSVVANLKEQQSATAAFSDAVSGKLPSIAVSVGKSAGKQATDAIAKGIAAFS